MAIVQGCEAKAKNKSITCDQMVVIKLFNKDSGYRIAYFCNQVTLCNFKEDFVLKEYVKNKDSQ